MKKNLEKKVDDILERGVNEVIDRENLRKKLLSGKKLRVKLGIDPTSPNLHLGRAVVIFKLKDLQELGHRIIFIIGDFTGVIGDTSDKKSERPMLSQEEVEKNLESYKEQVGKLLDLNQVEFHRNSEWLEKLGYKEIAKQTNVFSLAEFNARENIKKRLDQGSRVSLRELLYPLMQGYDSVAVEADLEIGGTDQRFNLLAGREMQRHYGQKSQDILMTNLIEGTDGRKMSSSWGNTINLLDKPDEMFGKIMSVSDNLITKYFIYCTRVPMDEIEEIEKDMKKEKLNPRDAKIKLAEEIVKIYYGEENAQEAKDYFINTFSKRETPQETDEFQAKEGENLPDFLARSGGAKNKSDARRKIEQGGVSLDNERITDVNYILKLADDGKVVRVGKKFFRKIRFLGA